MLKKSLLQHIFALILAIILLLVLDRLTNRLDVVEGHAWDFVYYIDMAENGVFNNDHLGAPYAYRPLTPLLARGINLALGTPTSFGFRVTAYFGLAGTLFGLYLIARKLGASFAASLVVMLMPAVALFNVKFLLFDFYRPDQLAYLTLVFAFLALLYDRWWLALILSLIGLQTREYPVIPILIILFETARDWKHDRRNVKYILKAGIVIVSVGLAVGLPRALIPVTFTQQILDPFNDPEYLRTLLGMPFDWNRDFNYLFNLAAYWMPTLILATPQRLKTAWQDMGRMRAWFIIYIAVNLVGMMYGGTDMMRYATYFFLPQAFLLIGLLKQDIHIFEALYVLAAMVIFNRILYLFPIWDFNAYLDFYGGYGDHVNNSSYLRLAELVGFIALGRILSRIIRDRKPFPEFILSNPGIFQMR